MPCVHEFCIMPTDPCPEEEFDYTPEKFPEQVVVDDDLLNDWAGRHQDLWSIPVYYESMRRPDKGLAWYGITLIPPSSAPAFLALLDDAPEREAFRDLAHLLHRAEAAHKFVIHYGI